MQARAIFEAAVEVTKRGVKAIPEIMIPLVGHVQELALQREVVVDTAKKVFEETGAEVEYLVGTMIELPRAALTANEIAEEADFFSFGTNDLTQTTFGMSRDDAGKFLGDYVDGGILEHDPFQVLDQSEASVSWCRSARTEDAKPVQISKSVSAVNTAVSRALLSSAMILVWTMFLVLRSVCRWHDSLRRKLPSLMNPEMGRAINCVGANDRLSLRVINRI